MASVTTFVVCKIPDRPDSVIVPTDGFVTFTTTTERKSFPHRLEVDPPQEEEAADLWLIVEEERQRRSKKSG